MLVLIPKTWGIGNASTEVYYGLARARRRSAKLLLILPLQFPRGLGPRRVDPGVFDVESPLLVVPPLSIVMFPLRFLVSAAFAVPYLVSRLLRRLGVELPATYTHAPSDTLALWAPSRRTSSFSWSKVEAMDWPNTYRHQIPIGLSRRCQHEFANWQGRIGLPKDAWYACLHVRESGFHQDDGADEARNATPENYIDAIRLITSRGGWVVRLGDASMMPLPPLEHLVDLAVTTAVTGRLQAAIIANCRFYIGMQSGPMDMALLWQRPRLLLNLYSAAFQASYLPSDFGVYKHFFQAGREVGPEATLWASDSDRAPDFSLPKLEYLELSPSEIAEAIATYLKFLDSGRCAGGADRQREALKPLLRSFIEQTTFSSHHRSDLEYKYVLASRAV